MPPETREKAKEAEKVFERLYSITGQQGRWEVSWVPAATAPLADPDPLPVGSKRISGRTRYFLIADFNLTTAERYVFDEFCGADRLLETSSARLAQ